MSGAVAFNVEKFCSHEKWRKGTKIFYGSLRFLWPSLKAMAILMGIATSFVNGWERNGVIARKTMACGGRILVALHKEPEAERGSKPQLRAVVGHSVE